MSERNCLILTQYREGDEYNDFIGKYYHFPVTSSKNYLAQFSSLPIEIVYYEPEKKGKGEFYGYGKIVTSPFVDKRDPGHYFVEISDYKSFSKPVYFKNNEGKILETLYNKEHYNYNNAVRKVNSEFLDDICLDGGIILNFTADAHLIQVLGEQLIASERVGILELIKNSYDANANNCTVRFEKIPGLEDKPNEYIYNELEGPVIIITDDGDGMDRNVIENGWLRPASTLKTDIKEQIKKQKKDAIASGKIGVFNRWLDQYRKANRGRLPLGEKGVGRFATHRLGRYLIIRTKTKNIDFEYVLRINWDDFNLVSGKMKDLDSVHVNLTKESTSRDYGIKNSGTQLIIYGGREGFNINRKILDEINESIVKLNSPDLNTLKKRKEINKTKVPFSVSVECPQIGEFITESIYDLAEPIFTLDGIVDENGILNYDLLFNPPTSNQIPFAKEKLAKDALLDLRKTIDVNNPFFLTVGEFRAPSCGEFYIHLDLWYRVSPWIETIHVSKVRDLLDDYGGISIYRDSLNLFPAEWGAEMDWLNLSKRHIKKGEHISYYNMMGYVELEQGKNIDIIDKTDRQGLIENTAFNDLAELVSAIVFRVEMDYKMKRDNLTDIRKSIINKSSEIDTVSHQASNLVDNIIIHYDIVKDPIKLFSSISSFASPDDRQEQLIGLSRSLKELEKSVKQMRLIEERLIEEAGFGKAVSVSIHELAKITTNLYNGIIQVLSSPEPSFNELSNLKDASASLRSELKNLSPLRTIKNEPKLEFEIKKSIEFVSGVFKRKLKASNIVFSANTDQSFPIYSRYGEINQILSNLFDNSIYWLNTLDKKDKDFANKKLELRLDNKKRTIIIADNGPGIHEAIMPYLFQSGASMRIPPSGLGLYICRYYMNRLKGDIFLTNANENIQELKGAQFTLDFSRTPYIKDDNK